MCGENRDRLHYSTLAGGSPPRVRGKQLDEEDAKIQVRITPACAGKTMQLCSKNVYSKDHPRVCGENT